MPSQPASAASASSIAGAVLPKYSTPRRDFFAAARTTGCGTSVAAVANFFSSRCTL